jgi:uncharacterized phage protein (TIGR01671 family)
MSSPRKFRVWDGEEIHEPPHEYVWDPRSGARRVIDASNGRVTCSQPIDGEVLWGTGLTDAEGTEIWEGDLLKRHEFVNQRMKDLKYEGYDPTWVPDIVVWSELIHDWGVVIATSSESLEGETRLYQIVKEETVTVVGNRYENPEMLQEIG